MTAAADFYRERARLTGSVLSSDWRPQFNMRERRLTLPRFIQGDDMHPEQATPQRYGRRADDDETMRRARRADDDTELDDEEQTVRCRRCGRFVRADDSDESLDDSEETLCTKCAADDEQLSDDSDLDDDMELDYDSGTLWREDQSSGFARSSAQVDRSDGATNRPARDSRRHSGPDSLRPGMSPSRDPLDVDHRWQQMGYDGPPGRGQMAPVRGSERYMTGTEKVLARRLAAVEAAVSGSNVRLMIDAPPATSVLGEDLVADVHRYGRQHRLNLRDPQQKLMAYMAVSGGDPNNLAAGVENEYAIRATHSRDLELVELVTDGELVDRAKVLAPRHGLDYNDPDQRLRAMQLAAAGR